MTSQGEQVGADWATSSDDATKPIAVRDAYEVLGYRVLVGAASRNAQATVRSLLRGFGPIAAPSEADLPRYDLTATVSGWQVRLDDAVIYPEAYPQDTLLNAVAALELRMVDAALERLDDRVHLHGAALCLPTRRAGILLIGESGSGKTTLTLGLMLRGFVPFTDDAILIDPATLEVRAVRRAFHVDEDTWRVVEPLAGSPLGGNDPALPGYFSPPQWAERDVPVRWVIFPRFEHGRTPQLEPMSTAEAAVAILAQTQSLTRAPRPALAAAARLAEHARCYRFVTGDLSESVAMIQQLAASLSVPD